MSRIRWTDEERAALVQGMVAVLHNSNYRPTDTDLLREAQIAALPPARRRKIEGSVAYNAKPLIQKARALAKDQAAAPTPEPAPEPPTLPAPEPTLGLLFEQLVDALADRIVLRVLDLLPRDRIEVREAPQALPPNIEAERAARPGVLVLGLLPQQAETVRRMFPGLNITAYDADAALKRDLTRRAHTVLMTKFINHSVQDRYRKAPNLHFCNGGVTELAAILKTIA